MIIDISFSLQYSVDSGSGSVTALHARLMTVTCVLYMYCSCKTSKRTRHCGTWLRETLKLYLPMVATAGP